MKAQLDSANTSHNPRSLESVIETIHSCLEAHHVLERGGWGRGGSRLLKAKKFEPDGIVVAY